MPRLTDPLPNRLHSQSIKPWLLDDARAEQLKCNSKFPKHNTLREQLIPLTYGAIDAHALRNAIQVEYNFQSSDVQFEEM